MKLKRRKLKKVKTKEIPPQEIKISKLKRRTLVSSNWQEQEEYQNYPLKICSWEDEGGVTRTTYYVHCIKHQKQIALEVCIKGIFNFTPRSKFCRKCFSLPKKIDFPDVFLKTPKENRIPEAMMYLTEAQKKQNDLE
jgi:hypothetical protein